MSALKQKLARIGATAGVLAGSTAAMLAVSGIGAASASAAPTCVNIPAASRNLQGQGSTLQRAAQELWTGREVPSEFKTLPYAKKSGGYAAGCAGAENATFSYTGTGSGSALTAFGFTGESVKKEFAYVGTDEAPTEAQIKTATEKAKVAPAIIPVAQTSIAVVANIPAACALTGGINYADLTKLFAGTITKWSQVSTVTNKTGCETKESEEANSNINRVVRSDGSGTTYQFKNYLSVLATTLGGVGPGKVNLGAGCVETTWAALETTGTPNVTWPEGGCNTGVTTVVPEKGGGGVASYVAANVNTIGYAAYPDAKAKSATSIGLENAKPGKTGTPFALPGTGTEEKEANCSTRSYVVPAKGRTGGTNTGLSVDWSQVFGAVPTIGGTAYPLCTLTYDIAWNGYNAVGYAEGAKVGEATHAYINYVLNTAEGGSLLSTNYYAKLPKTENAETNVQGAAELAAGNIK